MAHEMTAYTDGSFRQELGLGGWGVVLIDDSGTREYYGCEEAPNSYILELRAVIVAIRKTPTSADVIVYTDCLSAVDVFNTFSKGFPKGYPKGLRRSKKIRQAKHRTIWRRVMQLTQYRNISLEWVKSHSGIAGNDRADYLARKAVLESDEYMNRPNKLVVYNSDPYWMFKKRE
jgi:ribonuclease HI